MSTRSLGKLTLDLEARIGTYEAGLDKAARLAEKRAKEIQKQFEKVGQVVGASLAVLTTVTTAAVVKAIGQFDELDEMAQKVGASVSALSQLQFAADLEGVENFTGALVKLNRSMVESASNAEGEQARAFRALGVSVTDAAGELKSTDQVLTDIAQAFSEAEDSATKSAVAMALFGKTGADLIPFLNNGADGLQRLRDRADALGFTIDERTAAAAGRFNDNLFLMGRAAEGLTTRIAANLMPALESLSSEFVDLSTDGETAKALADKLLVGFQGVALVVANVSYVMKQIGNEIGGIAAQAAALARLDFSGAAAIHDAMVADAADARKRIDELNTALLNLGKVDEQVRAQVEKASEGGKSKIQFGAEATFDGSFDLKSIGADALRPLEEQITAEHDLLELRLQQEQDYHQASYEAELDADKRRKSVADGIATYQRQQIDSMVMQAEAIAGVLGMAADAASAFGAKGFAAFKALKIAEALISIPSSAIKAYESALAVPVIGPALAPAAAAAAVAVQLAQVQQIRSTQFTGYELGGYTGDMGRKQVAGVVHGQEYVINADATARYRGILDQMNSGAPIGGGVVEPAQQAVTSLPPSGRLQLNIQNAPPGYRPVVNGNVAMVDMLEPWAEHSANLAVCRGAAQLASRTGPMYSGLQAGSVVRRRDRPGKVYG